jgi:hypothetical protein
MTPEEKRRMKLKKQMDEKQQTLLEKRKKKKKDYNLHDFVFPGGKTAMVARLRSPDPAKFKAEEICKKFKLDERRPVIVLAGLQKYFLPQFLAGICRAAYKTGALIIDSGVKSGIEQYCIRQSKPPLLIFRRRPRGGLSGEPDQVPFRGAAEAGEEEGGREGEGACQRALEGAHAPDSDEPGGRPDR